MSVKFLKMSIKKTSALGCKKYGSQTLNSDNVNKCLLAQRQYGLKEEKMFVKENEEKKCEKIG